jgi:RHH-type proline utilization regulon transcriptional repressor/proline dehydrogenase/delta 1-pyrroline-5-carboxylate dehydrogenase
LYHFENEFSKETDYFHLRGQDNLHRYLPVGTVMVRIDPADSLFEVLARIAAVRIASCRLYLSAPPGLDNQVTDFINSDPGQRLSGGEPIHGESDTEVAGMIADVQRIRYAAPGRVPLQVLQAAAAEPASTSPDHRC